MEYGGRVYAVDQENRTISFDGAVCTYDADSRGDITFTAPDGATAYWQQSGNLGSGGWSEDWDEAVGPYELMGVLEKAAGRSGQVRGGSGSPLLGLLLLAVGAFNALVPQSAWYLSYGWRYKDVQPSEAALAMGRIGGAAAILIGIVLLLV